MYGFRSQQRWIFAAFAVSILFLCYAVDRAQFGQVLLGFSVAFYGYYHWIEKENFRSVKEITRHALIIRLLILFSTPLLSDDFYRFIWDGLIQVQGINPFTQLPSEFSGQSHYLVHLQDSMNSPEYYSVYPPLMQWIFHGISLLVGENELGQIIGMRSLLILSDLGIIWVGNKILGLLGKNRGDIALYAFNPLVIVEVVGNLHFEGMMLFFTLLGIYLLMRWQKDSNHGMLVLGAVSIAAGVLTKMVLLLSIPAMWRKWGGTRTILVGLLSLVFIGIGFAFFIDQTLILNLGQSLDLYFRNFEFNASLFALSRGVASHWIPHYTVETIGPYISLVMLLSIVAIALFRRPRGYEGYFETLLFILSIHLLFSSTVHPWYIVNLIGISLFTRYRYPIVWSFTAVISYFMYSNDFIEVWWINGIEYLIVIAYMIYEFREKNED